MQKAEARRKQIKCFGVEIYLSYQPFVRKVYIHFDRGHVFAWLGRRVFDLYFPWYEYPYLNDLLYDIEPIDTPFKEKGDTIEMVGRDALAQPFDTWSKRLVDPEQDRTKTRKHRA
ncbi:hypothetical protein GWO43_30195 [candidate division KSB1 bacterium]|nr:hypothetical protein [candidate division KSB1 bacterium]NIV70629.1 hypothetical protein [Phycisphaerae bacterium]NIS28162.1 hypothetical protein [candidate division KSB1 bacterium]NIT75054.1 hypothetical protein [candidate division KSB1 bacterium]NIU28840.1 hypothetical protein [candidate division KSB1 bacterium]